MLLGEFRLTLDDAGRLCLPEYIREVLHKRYAPAASLIVSAFYSDCLVLFPEVEWHSTQEQFQSAGVSRENIESFRTLTEVCPLDRQGRVSIPLAFRQYAGLEREVILIGVMKCLELWSHERWERLNREAYP